MMHKKIIGIAVAAALAAPLAVQADVTLSGAIQGEIGSVELAGADRKTISTDNTGTISGGGGPNMLRFDMSEDLGGGLKALARADWAFNTTQGADSNNFSNREKYLGFGSSSGAYFRMGRIQGAYKTATKIDPFYGTGAQMRMGGGESAGNAFTHSGFVDNAFEAGFNNHGFKVALQGVFDELSGMDGSYLADVEYGNDMFTVFGAYANKADDNTDDTANWKVGGLFNYAGATLGLQYEDAEMGAGYMGDPTASPNLQGQFISLSAKYAIKNVILGAWVGSFIEDSGDNDNERTDDLGNVSEDISNIGDNFADFGDSMSYSLGAIYVFGKRTLVYAAYHSTDSDSKDMNGNDNVADWNAFAAGVRHSF